MSPGGPDRGYKEQVQKAHIYRPAETIQLKKVDFAYKNVDFSYKKSYKHTTQKGRFFI